MYRGLAANNRAVKISWTIARAAGNVSVGPRVRRMRSRWMKAWATAVSTTWWYQPG